MAESSQNLLNTYNEAYDKERDNLIKYLFLHQYPSPYYSAEVSTKRENYGQNILKSSRDVRDSVMKEIFTKDSIINEEKSKIKTLCYNFVDYLYNDDEDKDKKIKVLTRISSISDIIQLTKILNILYYNASSNKRKLITDVTVGTGEDKRIVDGIVSSQYLAGAFKHIEAKYMDKWIKEFENVFWTGKRKSFSLQKDTEMIDSKVFNNIEKEFDKFIQTLKIESTGNALEDEYIKTVQKMILNNFLNIKSNFIKELKKIGTTKEEKSTKNKAKEIVNNRTIKGVVQGKFWSNFRTVVGTLSEEETTDILNEIFNNQYNLSFTNGEAKMTGAEQIKNNQSGKYRTRKRDIIINTPEITFNMESEKLEASKKSLEIGLSIKNYQAKDVTAHTAGNLNLAGDYIKDNLLGLGFDKKVNNYVNKLIGDENKYYLINQYGKQNNKYKDFVLESLSNLGPVFLFSIPNVDFEDKTGKKLKDSIDFLMINQFIIPAQLINLQFLKQLKLKTKNHFMVSFKGEGTTKIKKEISEKYQKKRGSKQEETLYSQEFMEQQYENRLKLINSLKVVVDIKSEFRKIVEDLIKQVEFSNNDLLNIGGK